MGVPGLWKLLEPVRCSIDLGQLSGKVIAIDMNIWLHQAVKSRASAGSHGTYLAVLFRRICKLLYFGIRPVFVFDGAVPALKKATMAARRQLRGQLGSRAEKAEQRLIRRLLRRIAEGSHPPGASSRSNEKNKSVSKMDDSSGIDQSDRAKTELLHRLSQREETRQAKEEAQLFNIPEGQEIDSVQTGDLLDERAGLEFDGLAHDYLMSLDMYSQSPSLDLRSESFAALPLKAQIRVVQLARERLDSKDSICGHQGRPVLDEGLAEGESSNVEDFSNKQVTRLLFRRQLAEREQELSSQLTTEEAASQLMQQLTDEKSADHHQQQHWAKVLRAQLEEWTRTAGLASQDAALVTSALRIQSRSSGHAILVKRSPMKITGGAAPGLVAQNTGVGKTLSLESLIRRASEDKMEGALEANDFQTDLCNIQDEPTDESSSSSGKTSCSEHDTDVLSEPVVCSYSDEVSGREGVKSVLPSDNSSASEKNTTLKLSPSTLSASQLTNNQDINGDTMSKQPVAVTTSSPHDVKVPKRSPNPEPVEESSDEDDFIEVGMDDMSNHQNLSEHGETVNSSTKLKSATSTDMRCELVVDSVDVKNADVEAITANIYEKAKEEEIEDDSFHLDDDFLREEADRLMRQAQTTTTRYIEEAQELLRLFGLPFVISPEEAEAQCVSLQHSRQVDLVASDDSDVWPFGVHAVCRHLFGSRRTTGKKTSGHRQAADPSSPSRYTAAELKQKLGLSAVNILRLTLLCGSDYTPGIANVGPVTAVEILGEFEECSSASVDEVTDSPWSLIRASGQPEAVIDSVMAPLNRFVDWQTSAFHLDKKALSADALSVRRKWLKLSLPRGFPENQVVRAYLQPNVIQHVGTLVWKAPDAPALINTEAMLSSVFKQQQQRLAAGSLASTSTKLIPDYFGRQQQYQPIGTCGESTETIGTSKSKRFRLAADRLLQRSSQSEEVPPATSSTPLSVTCCDSHSRMPVQGKRGRSERHSARRGGGALQTDAFKPTGRGRRSSRQKLVVSQRLSISESDSD